jgi:RNA polymerase sigma-70 factor (ECF subfamily)
MERLADGDRAAFHAVFVIVWPLLKRFTERALHSSPDGEDAAQQALLKLFLRASLFERGRDALPFILAFAMNECRTLRRKGQRRREDSLDGAGELPRLEPSPEEDAIARDLERAALEVLEGLPSRDIEAIARSLADEDRAPTSTLRKRLERARRRLRAAWSERHGIL